MRGLLSGIFSLLAPPVCPRCRRLLATDLQAGACRTCLEALPAWPRDRCAVCGEGAAAAPGLACAACAAAGLPLAGAIAALCYAGEAEDWIRRFKYPPRGLAGLDAAPGALLEAALRRALRVAGLRAPERVVPVPLHPRRLRARGFNPSLLLARAAARESGAALDAAALLRVRDTPSQTGLDRAARRRNVAGAFTVRRTAAIPPRVWLVDDVVTTGATLREAAHRLRRAGAREVVGVCVARTPFAR